MHSVFDLQQLQDFTSVLSVSYGGNMRSLVHLTVVVSLWGCSSIPPAQIPSPSHNKMGAIVSDIDGTLTPGVFSVCTVRPDSAKAISALADKGYKIIYVTTRHLLFQSGLPKWLRENGFPEGVLHVAQTREERNHPESYKARILKDYVQKGWQLEYAYGDSTTDFVAYHEAGIPKERIFALKRSGSENCRKGIYQACLDGWTEYLSYIDKEVPSTEEAIDNN